MGNILAEMLSEYKATTLVEYDTALKEVIQKIVLLGLWRSKFFEHAAFYGGTALRLLYGLDRFSEDLDFSLLEPDTTFALKKYFSAVQTELRSYGVESDVSQRSTPRQGNTESAFVKANTKEHLLEAGIPQSLQNMIPVGKMLKIKFEVDIDPPGGFAVESKTVLSPIPYHINTYTLSDIYAGKMHAVLCRAWKERVKGRDWYDLVWFVRKGIPLNMDHLKMRLIQTGHVKLDDAFTKETFLKMLQRKIESLDIHKARDDVAPFIEQNDALSIWSRDFFHELSGMIKFQEGASTPAG